MGSHRARPEKPRAPIPSASAPTRYCELMAPTTPIEFIIPKRAPTWRPLTPMAADHHNGCVDCAAEQDSAVNTAASHGSGMSKAPTSRAAEPRNAAQPSRRFHTIPPEDDAIHEHATREGPDGREAQDGRGHQPGFGRGDLPRHLEVLREPRKVDVAVERAERSDNTQEPDAGVSGNDGPGDR